jgi:streptogramin lyase
MKKTAVLSIVLGAAALSVAEVSHRFIINEFKQGKAFVIAADRSVERVISGLEGVQDGWMLENGNLLFSHKMGVKEIAPDDSVVWEYKSPDGVELHSVQLLENGNALACECGTKRLIEIDRKSGAIVKEIPLEVSDITHRQFRTARQTQTGTYWVMYAGESKAKEVDASGAVLREITLGEGIHKAHGVDPLPNGNVLVATAHGHSVEEYDPQGNRVWCLSEEDIKKAGAKKVSYIAGIKRLENGNTVISMYRGNPQLFEVTPDKKIVWKYYNKNLNSVVGFHLLD